MHIALCHNALIPPAKYGGTERIIYWLARALNRLGHQTTLVAQPGSNVPGTRFIPYQEGVAWESLVPGDVDLLHLWATPNPSPRRPFVVTIEGNGQTGELFHANTLFISRKHAENHAARHFVFNGLDPEDYTCAVDRENYVVFLAKASWKVKNLAGAIAVARGAGLRLEVLGSRDWPLGLQRLVPAIRGVHYRGMVGDAEKREVLSRARALLFPVRWHEPFGIAITEALASGCAVLGTPYGSLPEIITPDVGVLSANGRDLVDALKDPGRFSPERCRQRIYEGFSDRQMAQAYLGYYESVLRTGRIGDNSVDNPHTLDRGAGLSARSLLPWTSP
ncbi:MAG: glycosyltransferase [Deltaproteobacteria bacterium]|nr:glycosyltransferase [Deltaproteobacteria bacterium]